MAAKEVKNGLKNARDAIQNKDYVTALKHCKAVLKLDKSNYNAFVFVGVASLELGKAEQAQAAYKKAISVNAENILAWQGLASLFEKGQEFGNKEDMVEVYEKLISHYQSADTKKWRDVVIKLADLQKHLKNIAKALELLMLLTDTENEKDQYLTWLKIIFLLQENENTLSLNMRKELIHAYKNLLHSNNLEANEETQVYFQNYVNLLLDQKSNDALPSTTEIKGEANRMRELFKNNEFPLKILTRIYLEEIEEVSEEESTIYQELLEISPVSPLALLGLGKVKLFEKDLTQAEELLQNGLQGIPTSSTGWYFFSTVQLLRHKYTEAESSAIKGLSCLKKEVVVGSADFIHFNLSVRKATACSKQGKEKMLSSVQDFEELSRVQPNNLSVHCELGRAFLRLNDLDSAKKCLENCRSIDNTLPVWLTLEGEIYSAEGKLEDAEKSFLQMIEVQNDVAENYLNLGKLHWNMDGQWRNDKDNCLGNLLKAAKLDPFHSSTFLYLGHYYKVVGSDMNKAHRCYKKAHDLNPLCDEAGEALGDACMSLEREEEAVQLYKTFTTTAGIGRAKWAWLRLGLHYLKHEQHNESIQCLQNALRVDVKDPTSWECLGEAYMSRGSYTAALASFTRANELDPSLLYSRYQIASVKHLLGVFDEAVLVYKGILDEQSDYVPALKGLGETYISYARSALSQDFHGRAVDYIQNAIVILARAIQCHGDLSCLWKLLGDACSLVFKIHENKIRMELPINLRTFLAMDVNSSVGKMEVLTLGSSSYGQAVRYNPKCSGLWHDLGCSYYRLSVTHNDSSERQRFCERSVKALKKALTMEPDNYNTWNTLGVVAASKEISNPELSQHAFIKSIHSQKNAIAWTNLGVLYLSRGKADMANKAFNDAQCTDPSYTQAWVGQATIAEMFGHEEAMDLYRHSNALGTHVEGYLGYAHWVCHTLLSSNGSQRSSIVKGKPLADLSHLAAKYRNIVLTASVALTKYTDQILDNACAFNMHGILLEHQELYSQAETAYARSLQLLESGDETNPDYCNIVRANYARVLCALGKYSESVKTYQAISPLTDFYHITGLALAFFMVGQLRESFQAYEQALELATDVDQKSHIRAAMGMIGYVLNDIAGAKQMFFESSQMMPASEQGLLAFSAMGLIISDFTLAAAALSELVKVGQGGNESLIAEASYLFATFYVLQGSASIGKSYIVTEIHRRPQSSLLWNNLATFILRFQPNKLKEAGRCAEAAHRLGDRNVKDISTTCAYSTIGAGRNPVTTTSDSTRKIPKSRKLVCGIRAAQKAVHMQPDSLTNWTLLAAALADDMTGHEVGRSTAPRNSLCEVVTQFALKKAIEESKNISTRPERYERRYSQILESSQKWLALQLGYCLHYSGRREEAIKHCQQALQLWRTDTSFSSRIQLLVVEIDCSRDNVQIPAILDDVVNVLVLNQETCYAWLFSAAFHERHGFIKAAEYCYRNCLQLANRLGSLHGRVVSLVRLAHLALRQAMKEEDKLHWSDLILEASSEALKLLPGCNAAILLQGISYYLKNHIRQAKDLMHTINHPHSSWGAVASFYLVLLNMKKREKGETIEDVLRTASNNLTLHSLQDLLLYVLAMYFDGTQRKKLLAKCIHINPSEIRFWNALNKL